MIKVFWDREVKDRVRFVVRFDPRLPNFKQILKGSWSVLTEDLEMREVCISLTAHGLLPEGAEHWGDAGQGETTS